MPTQIAFISFACPFDTYPLVRYKNTDRKLVFLADNTQTLKMAQENHSLENFILVVSLDGT